MYKIQFAIVCVFLALIGIQTAEADEAKCKRCLDSLIEGNKRFASDRLLHPDRASERRQETALSQEPFATIVGCSDSRVPPEIIFDQGLGDLFIVRVAGNVVGPLELESIIYSAVYLHSALVTVLGHENCGAVKAVLQGTSQHVEIVVQMIQPAINEAKTEPGDRLANAVKDNVRNVVTQLGKNPTLRSLIDQKKLIIIGGYYNFHSGLVELL